ncbi:hypothetical protein [Haloplanus pelagicus]|jgi:predicted RNA-binding Zn-ribbon protein involved in translation (DUF1610 family)|uniref:hypothetical protein n=1 Tax=Haloplanus pelagicus TaxID=2949995 RepID=UPI00203FB58A|nr:hypothetical protein [Haloplanus sp. HW8-1]
MTGVLDGLRSWLGSLVGTDEVSTEEDGSAVADPSGPAAPIEGRETAVAHRDDRPLETPAALDPSPPTDTGRVSPTPEAPATGGDSDGPERVDIPDAEGGVDPDAASVTGAEGPEHPEPVDGVAVPDADAPEDGSEDTTDREAVDDEAGAFACPVCGTTVDGTAERCPLCGSTDVQPGASSSNEAVGSPRGRSTVSGSDDDRAVDRLRDLRDRKQ